MMKWYKDINKEKVICWMNVKNMKYTNIIIVIVINSKYYACIIKIFTFTKRKMVELCTFNDM